MNFPRQPGPVKIVVTSDHPDDVYRAFLSIRKTLENHYASITGHTDGTSYTINCFPFAVND